MNVCMYVYVYLGALFLWSKTLIKAVSRGRDVCSFQIVLGIGYMIWEEEMHGNLQSGQPIFLFATIST